MSKAFVKETDDEPDLPDDAPQLPSGLKNYMTPDGHRQMQEELRRLLREDRPKTVEVVAWAAGNGDRSEKLQAPGRAPEEGGGAGSAFGGGPAENGRGRGLGRRQRRPLGKWRLSLRQEAPARDRPPHPLSVEAAGDRSRRRSRGPEKP